jgi:5'-nucleotidase
MRILISNDDGVHAPGIKVLEQELSKLGQVWVVAPLEEKSTAGHSLTLHKPLRIARIAALGEHYYGVSGSPADCINLGIRQLRITPDVVVSGINRGANLGQDIYYSGTVSAAREACILGIPSMAVSLAIDFDLRKREESFHYLAAARMARKTLGLIDWARLPSHTLLNLNVPDATLSKIKGLRLTRQGFRLYSGSILKRKDHRGKDYYWVGGRYKGFKREDGTDCAAVAAGYASLTPLKLDTTDFDFLTELSEQSKLLREGGRP